ncbi:hypothetical protein [Siminovitchia sp. 179-K 8D1 HS]|uniref:hypothetical protein n=1 Tax=Siminovitchia sp. 179-K 8D1 HS TaxID=3142385 RepID=UPI0039A1B93C
MKVIETNISVDTGFQIYLEEMERHFDFQSRVIEVESWDKYINEAKGRRSITRNSIIGNLYGESFPRYASELSDLKYDNSHLSYSFTNGAGFRMIKLAYLVNE